MCSRGGGIYVMQISVFGYLVKDGGVMGGVLGVRVCFFCVCVCGGGWIGLLGEEGGEELERMEWWMHGGWTEEVWCTYD
jgi:hypothetical protein